MQSKPSLLKRIENSLKIKRYLLPFLKLHKKKLKLFEAVNDEKQPRLELLMNQLNDYSDYYREEINSFQKCHQETEEHNSKIKELKEAEASFNVKKFCENPLSYNEDELSKTLCMAKEANNFVFTDKIEMEKFEEILKLMNDRSVIIDQFKLHEDYNACLKLFDAYYDGVKKENIKNLLNDISLKLKNEKRYYSFSLLEQAKFNNYIEEHNDQFIKSHLKDPLFDDINGIALDKEQRTAILKDPGSSLIVSGAGSGKTLTICGKTKYLLEKGIRPEEILLLSYSKKSADDLEKKIIKINERLTVGTFHKIGLDILRTSSGKPFMVEDQFEAIVEDYFRNQVWKKPEEMRSLLYYYALYLYSDKSEKKYNNEGELFENLKSEDFVTLKSALLNAQGEQKELRTFKKEMVKSFEELAIANFYFINGIKYSYEKPYEVDVSTNEKRQYMPDFYLDDYKIYHEHYGIGRDGKASQYKGEEAKKYTEGILWKRKTHAINGTTCLETYSYEFKEGTIFEDLTRQLDKKGIPLKPIGDSEVSCALHSIFEGRSFKSFISLVNTFISLYKGQYSDANGFDTLKKKQKFLGLFQRERTALFLQICKNVYLYYEEYLRANGKIDFDDMILLSQKALPSLEGFKYKYIIVDEFQDISYSRMRFLKGLIAHGNSKLFAVGDDWQAIYRFSGSDLNIFLHFTSIFDDAEISKISTTHRNSQELQDIVSSFIERNSQQIKKDIRSSKHLMKPIKLFYFNGEKSKAFCDVLDRISKIKKNANVLVLGRNKRDANDVVSSGVHFDNAFGKERNSCLISEKHPEMKLRFSTVHSSKGLEEDFVILINGEEGKYGFPNKVEDDDVLNLVLSQPDKIEYAEERRLWYVALTRTRTYVYVLVDSTHPSSFVDEIENYCDVINKTKDSSKDPKLMCPRCKKGVLIKRQYQGREFYGCSNYPYCKYKINNIRAVGNNIRCPVCGDFMVPRRANGHTFLGCNNYPRCHYTTSITVLDNQSFCRKR